MRIWESRSNGDPLSLPPRLLTALLGAVTDDERPRLPQAMLDLARHEVEVINCALFLLPDAHGRPQFLSHAQVVEPSTVQGAGQAYTDGFYRRDLALQSALRRRARGNLLLLQGVDDIPDRAYRSACYEEVNTAQRFSVIRPLDGQAHLMLSFYRSARSAPLGAAEVRYLGALAEVLIEAGVQHCRARPTALSNAAGALRRLQDEAGVRLSRRENEILDCLLRGMTQEASAKALGIAPTSVVTYRNRAFGKLGVASRQDFFARLLEQRPNA
ncbi:helix-turn-helix transcriptional regulator [Pseudomonas aeruginosa]|uniref:helix-turn-helix transcriptional regulator n=1 Tax=Pseudomonas aeruginosa TaxID=287 RepID=UPI00053D1092|nr:helix-turn-helix transcriptional regulator [Pseudomonas aeruginosa]KSP57518.1 helix-turn-helix transcriptional regulator [Pseudomonas aeruginosa]MBI8148776.1 helix-turn-helix transcriptional regulator [Pseudomonas aeruginosa]MBW0970289.1 helix-turn-helix transcriptional regulator [Pseudomonas aeruginosa]MCO2439146.1 helix-turn-helix transcriptional regulator [Pseudomonas aeruginosa]MCO3313383.1 helix-turn-helix transcriptional regulator [Pseudomonas aeruginosa]